MAVSYLDQVKEAADHLRERLKGISPSIGLILGSGLGDLAEQVQDAVSIDYSDIPGFPISTVEGHAGRFAAGTLEASRSSLCKDAFIIMRAIR